MNRYDQNYWQARAGDADIAGQENGWATFY